MEEHLKEYLQEAIHFSEVNDEPYDEADWRYEMGVLITREEAEYLLNTLRGTQDE